MPSEESTSYAIFIYSLNSLILGLNSLLLVVQWLKICFAMQRTHVQPLIQEDPQAETFSLCAATTELVLWTPASCSYWAHEQH